MPQSRVMLPLSLISLLFILLAFSCRVESRKELKCQGDECQMKAEHFRLYSTVKRALDKDFNIKGKDLVSVIRSVEVLERRFKPQGGVSKERQAIKRPASDRTLNGTQSVLALLANEKLSEAMKVFSSDEGIQLINLYKSSINGNEQNLACSKWRVAELEMAARKLDQNEQLARVFSNVHKNFVERSARKCLKSSCSSLDENMSRLDSVVRRSSRRKGFLAQDEPLSFEPTSLSVASTTEVSSSNGSKAVETSSANAIEEALIAQLDNEPASEFHSEELELCKFFKLTNSSHCQASGNELNAISFAAKPATEPTSGNSTRNLADYLAAYGENRSTGRNRETTWSKDLPSELVLEQCGAIKPVLDYHLFGLRWFQRQKLISAERVRARTFWCPSLTYWFEIDRLCNELKLALTTRDGSESFTY